MKKDREENFLPKEKCLFVRHTCLFVRHKCLFVRHKCLFVCHKCFSVTNVCVSVTYVCVSVTYVCLSVTLIDQFILYQVYKGNLAKKQDEQTNWKSYYLGTSTPEGRAMAAIGGQFAST